MQVGNIVRHNREPKFEGKVQEVGLYQTSNELLTMVVVRDNNNQALRDEISTWDILEDIVYFNGKPVVDVEYAEVISGEELDELSTEGDTEEPEPTQQV